MNARVDLLFAIKPLERAKTRLRGVPYRHEALVLAIAADTVETALRSRFTRTVLVITSDPSVRGTVEPLGASVADDPGGGLNGALRHGARLLREADTRSVLGALQPDLAALRETELDAAFEAADGARAYCADRHGTGTSLLLSAPGAALEPRFGNGSAAAHERSGAKAVPGALPGLRTDVDTAADLAAAVRLGTGPRAAAVLAGRA